MYLHVPRNRKRNRSKTNRYRAKCKAKERRRYNGMVGRRLSNAKKRG